VGDVVQHVTTGAARNRLELIVQARSDAWFRTSLLLSAGDPEVARDVLQEVLERLVRRRLPDDANVDGYVTSSLVNAARDRWRRHRSEISLKGVERRHWDSLGHVDGDTGVILDLLRDLPDKQRAVLVLRYFEDLTEADTAKAMQISVGTVKSQSHRALARLRAAMQADREAF